MRSGAPPPQAPKALPAPPSCSQRCNCRLQMRAQTLKVTDSTHRQAEKRTEKAEAATAAQQPPTASVRPGGAWQREPSESAHGHRATCICALDPTPLVWSLIVLSMCHWSGAVVVDLPPCSHFQTTHKRALRFCETLTQRLCLSARRQRKKTPSPPRPVLGASPRPRGDSRPEESEECAVSAVE